MKRAFKRYPWLLTFVVHMLAAYIRLVRITGRLICDIHPEAAPLLNGKRNVICAFWHGRMMLMPFFKPPGRSMFVMISQHGDGELITRIMQCFDVSAVRGSSRKGGARVAGEALQKLEEGHNIAITPDGPRGPLHVAAPGTVRIAALSQVPIVPLAFGASRHIRMRSWDRFMLALPFARLSFVAEAPLTLTTPLIGVEEELAISAILTQRLKAAEAKADRMVGRADHTLSEGNPS